jgi:hypothetical protein
MSITPFLLGNPFFLLREVFTVHLNLDSNLHFLQTEIYGGGWSKVGKF